MLHYAKPTGTAILHAYEIYYTFINHKTARSDLGAGLLRVLSYVTTCVMLVGDRSRGTANDVFLSLFWLVTLIFEMPVYYRQMLTACGPVRPYLDPQEYFVSFPLVFV